MLKEIRKKLCLRGQKVKVNLRSEGGGRDTSTIRLPLKRRRHRDDAWQEGAVALDCYARGDQTLEAAGGSGAEYTPGDKHEHSEGSQVCLSVEKMLCGR